LEFVLTPHPETSAGSRDLRESLIFFAVATIGAAAFEAALVPGLVIGGVAWLGPRAVARLHTRGKSKRFGRIKLAEENRPGGARYDDKMKWRTPQLTTSAIKTVTFRVISSSLDFGWNYFLLGEIAAAASLSGVSLIAAPTFYFVHETLWGRIKYGGAVKSNANKAFRIPDDIGNLKVSRAIAKTVTFRLFATASEFGVNYFVVRDFWLAINLSAFSVVVGPFVYLAHEKAWERFGGGRKIDVSPVPSRLPVRPAHYNC